MLKAMDGSAYAALEENYKVSCFFKQNRQNIAILIDIEFFKSNSKQALTLVSNCGNFLILSIRTLADVMHFKIYTFVVTKSNIYLSQPHPHLNQSDSDKAFLERCRRVLEQYHSKFHLHSTVQVYVRCVGLVDTGYFRKRADEASAMGLWSLPSAHQASISLKVRLVF